MLIAFILLMGVTCFNLYAQIASPAPGNVAIIAGVSGSGSFSGDGGPATSARFNNPNGIAVDSLGNVYIADTLNDRIRKITASTGIITTVAGNGTPNYAGDGSLAINAHIFQPLGVAVDSAGNLYIADSYNHRIRKVTAATGIITTVAGNGSTGYNGDGIAATSATLYYPQGVAVDNSGNIYITDSDNNRVRKVSASTGIITTVAGNGTSGYTGDGGPATSAGLYNPSYLAVDSSGNLYITSQLDYVVRKVTVSTGIITTFAGNGLIEGDGGLATNAELEPYGIALDSSGNVYIADVYYHRIRVVSATTGIITSLPVDPGTYQFIGVAVYLNDVFGLADGPNGYFTAAIGIELEPPTVTETPSASQNPSVQGLPVTFSTYVDNGGADPTPTGTVNFYNGAANLGSANLSTVSTTNLAPYSQNFLNASWSPDCGASRNQLADGAAGPDGTMTATEIVIPHPIPTCNGSGVASIGAYDAIPGGLEAGTVYTASVWLQGKNGGESVSFGLNDSNLTTVTLTKSWNRYSYTFPPYMLDSEPNRGFEVFSVVPSATFYAWGAQTEASESLGPYVATTSSSASGTGLLATLSTAALPAGTQSISAVYSGDSNWWGSTSNVLTQNVQLMPAISWATPSAISYGTPLSAAQLNASTSGIAGTFSYSPSAGTELYAGLQTLTVTFTPTDTSTYATATSTVNITVNPVTPTVTWASPAAITYGTALSSAQLNASASVGGTFVYTPAAGAILNAGVQTLSATFYPADGIDYTTVTSTVTITVNPAVTQIVWAPANLTQGSALGTSQLDATVASGASGIFSYAPTAGTVLSTVGSTPIVATFTSSSPNYTSTAATKNINVQLKPAITWATPAAVSAGSVLWGAQLNASSAVLGSFTYNPPSGTALSAGTQLLTATFTPSDNVTYGTVMTTVNLVVNPNAPVLTWITPASIPYGIALWAQQLSASSSVPGSFVYNPPAGTVLNIGNNTLTATFTPVDAVNQASGGTVTTTIIVTQATPVITWSGLSAVPTGTTLGASQLSASASVPGTFVYTPAPGTVLSTSGVQTLSVTFTPTDLVHYAPVTATTTIAVTVPVTPITKTTPVITWPTPAAITAGTALTAAQLNASSSVQGTFSYSPALGTVLPVGTQILVATFTPTDTTHYNVAGSIVMLTVNPAPVAPKITWNQPAPVTYGTALWGAQLNASSNVAGTFVYTPASGTILQPGTQVLSVTFTPTNTASSPVTTTVPLVVNHVASVLKWNTPPVMTSETALWAQQLNASSSVPGSFVYTPSTGTVLTTGTYTLSATFTPTDSVHYTGGVITTTLTVK